MRFFLILSFLLAALGTAAADEPVSLEVPVNATAPPVNPRPVNQTVCLAAGCLPEMHTAAPATNTKQWWQTGIEVAIGALVTLDFTLRQTGH